MKAIETVYNGYRFRSRLEARWAVFYDVLGIKWEYEKEGYDLGSGIYYLPDFYIPHLDCWIEIKGQCTPIDNKIFELFSEQSEKKVYLFIGEIPNPDTLECSGPPYNENNSAYILGDLHYVWCECPDCGFVGIEFDGRSDRLGCKESYETWDNRDREIPGKWYEEGKCFRRAANGDKGYNGNSMRLIQSYREARYARFEHGESG